MGDGRHDLEIAESRDADAWDAFVRQSPGWTAFHLASWRRVMERVFPHTCHSLEVRREGRLEGVLPLVAVESRLFGRYLVSMPFVNYGGPLGSPEAVRALARTAAELAGARGSDLLELRSRDELPLDLDVSTRKITVVLDLPGDPDTLWDDLKSKVRSQVRRPRKEGYEVRFGSDQVAPFWAVFSRHMRDLGTPAQPEALFRAIADEMGDDAWFACVYDGHVPVAGGCGLSWGDEVEMTWASSLREYGRTAPNMLLYWAFMERAIERGLRTFNFGRCTPGGGTHRFKSQWGGRDEPLHWYQVSQGRDATPSPDEGRFSWGPRVWSRLPLPVANRLGPPLVRYIP